VVLMFVAVSVMLVGAPSLMTPRAIDHVPDFPACLLMDLNFHEYCSSARSHLVCSLHGSWPRFPMTPHRPSQFTALPYQEMSSGAIWIREVATSHTHLGRVNSCAVLSAAQLGYAIRKPMQVLA